MQLHLGAHYFDMLSKARKGYSRALEPICRTQNLTRNALDVLLFLYNNPEFDRAADIVSHRGIAKSHVSLSVMDLERKGLLTRYFEEGDRRTAHLKLTKSGTAIAQEGRSAQERYFTALYQGFSEPELEQMRQAMKKVHANMERLEQESERSL